MNAIPNSLLIVGCGFLGLRVAQLWQGQGGTVAAVTRSPTKGAELASRGVQPVIADLMRPETLNTLPATSCVLYCVGYDRTSSCSKADLYIDGLAHVITALKGRMDRCVYVSSTSVYGQDDGSWIDETSSTEPTAEGGRICWTAEQQLRQQIETATILRMSGLYGPDRMLARVEQLRAGEPIDGNPEAWLNLIHGDDAARACVAALTAPHPGPVYLVSDDRPVTRREYLSALAEDARAPQPQFSVRPTSQNMPQGLNKRCRNDRVKRELSLEWLYPTVLSSFVVSVD